MDITITPIAALSASISYDTMQVFVVVMIALVIVMTVIDMLHKKSAQYFFENAKKAKKNATKELSSGDKIGIAVSTVIEDVALSGEFCSFKRRLAHLLTMYGFILFNAMTAIIIFGEGESAVLAQLWHLGALMLAVGGWWFWLFIRVDVAAEGNKWYNIDRMDMFSLSLIATSTFALILSFVGGNISGVGSSGGQMATFILFVLSAVSLFGGVLWSKFAHMFFKPAAAYNKRTIKADGSRENLPEPADKPEVFGLGIKRSTPNNY